MPEQNGKYIYCLIRTPEPQQFSTLGIGERGDVVHTVNHMSLAAVVSDSPIIEYDSSRRNMMAHTLVLEEVMQSFNILPVRFCTIGPSTHAIQEQVIKRRYEEINGLLGEMEARIEMGLKAFWYEGIIFDEIVAENPSIRQLRDSLMGRRPEETYYERIRLGEMIEQAIGKKRDQESEQILARLRPLVYKTKTSKIITDRMVLNAALLIGQELEPDFDRTVQELDAEMGKRLMFKYVGPVPPYNFVNIVIHWDEED